MKILYLGGGDSKQSANYILQIFEEFNIKATKVDSINYREFNDDNIFFNLIYDEENININNINSIKKEQFIDIIKLKYQETIEKIKNNKRIEDKMNKIQIWLDIKNYYLINDYDSIKRYYIHFCEYKEFGKILNLKNIKSKYIYADFNKVEDLCKLKQDYYDYIFVDLGTSYFFDMTLINVLLLYKCLKNGGYFISNLYNESRDLVIDKNNQYFQNGYRVGFTKDINLLMTSFKFFFIKDKIVDNIDIIHKNLQFIFLKKKLFDKTSNDKINDITCEELINIDKYIRDTKQNPKEYDKLEILLSELKEEDEDSICKKLLEKRKRKKIKIGGYYDKYLKYKKKYLLLKNT